MGKEVNMARIVEHATKELVRVGLLDSDADYDGELGVSVLALCMLFASQGHSGESAESTIQLFCKLARRETL
jgi:hypothetical protein